MSSRLLPATRGDCPPPDEQCPYMSCRFHLWTDIKTNGRKIRVRHADGEMRVPDDDYDPPFDEQRHYPTCALNVADQGEHNTEIVADYVGLTRQRIESMEEESFAKLRTRLKVIYHEYQQD